MREEKGWLLSLLVRIPSSHPTLSEDSQLQVQVPLVGEGSCAHRTGVVQQAVAGVAVEA